MRILLRMRANALAQRGGDTVVMEKLHHWLNKIGHHAVMDVQCSEDTKKFDLVNIINFATPKAVDILSHVCVDAGVPFVVTTFHEDWPKFYNQMMVHELILRAFVKYGQAKEVWEKFQDFHRNVHPAQPPDNLYAATFASALIASGYNEAVALRRDYPHTNMVETFPCGSEISPFSDGGKLFREYVEVDDFILCVGRLERRKNQLGLLKALEDSSHTIVFAMGSVTYEPEYESACRSFKRRGKTIFLGEMPANVLASAYEACRVHAIISWHELPGLVSIEAAARGANIVVSDYGTVRDYVGDYAFYAEPPILETIQDAVGKAWNAPKRSELREVVKGFTWERATKRHLEIYERALASKHQGDEEFYLTLKAEYDSRKKQELTTLDAFPMLKEFVPLGK